jgi:hypothetical protein
MVVVGALAIIAKVLESMFIAIIAFRILVVGCILCHWKQQWNISRVGQ